MPADARWWDFCNKCGIIEPKLMRGIGAKRYIGVLLVAAAFVVVGTAGTVMATTSTSPHFELSEPEFGAGSAIETCSGQYCAQASIGDVGSGSSSSPSTTAAFSGGLGTVTEPLLEVIVEPGVSDLGVLSTTATSHRTMKLKVRNYLSDGYTIQITGNAPRYGDYALHTPTTPTAAEPGTEQFALNVVANTSPTQMGADPVQVPSGEMSFGYVMPDYATPNRFMYQSGAVIAASDKESGQTDYTITMIVNVAGNTPAGHFAGDYTAVVIPAF